MSIVTVVAAIKEGLEDIDSLRRVYDYPPDSIGAMPAAVILHQSPVVEFDETIAEGTHLYRLRVVVIVSQPGSESQSWDSLEAYMAATGSESVRAAVDGTARRVTSIEAAGRVTYNETPYWGVVFLVEDYAA